jgi:N-dimethylarginine dimethylaminohydrolase
MSTSNANAVHIYNETMKMFGVIPEPGFEDKAELERVWGRAWGVDNDVGRIRAVLMHRPGNEMKVIDPKKRIEEIGAFGDVKEGWYIQSDRVPKLADMQAEHDALAAVLKKEGIEIVYLEGDTGKRLKSVYTRDSSIMVKGGAIVTRLAPKARRGEELNVTRTYARHGIPILRTLTGTAIFEGGSFAWLNSKTAVIGRSIRVNDEGAAQVAEVLARQGVETLMVDLTGYQIHIDGMFVMLDRDLALIDPTQLPYWFIQKLASLGIKTIEITPQDSSWIINSLAVRPRRLVMSNGASNRTLDMLAKNDVEIVKVEYESVQLNGGGVHCSTMPLIRDSVD